MNGCGDFIEWGNHLVTVCTGEQKSEHSRARLKKLCGQERRTEVGKQKVGTQAAVLTEDAQDCGTEGT